MHNQYVDQARIGDHLWWISDVSKFRSLYPEWAYRYDVRGIMSDIYDGLVARLGSVPV